MNTPDPEPRGGHPEVTIYFEVEGSRPDPNGKFSQNGQQITPKKPGDPIRVRINGGDIYINGVNRTNDLGRLISDGVKSILVMRDSWSGSPILTKKL